MNRKIYMLIILILNTSLVVGQEELPLHEKKFSFEIEIEKSEGKLSESSTAYYYTYIGNYQKAIENYNLHLDWGLDTISLADSMRFLAYKPINAKQYLKEKTTEEQIVIISEAHQMPQHRIFTTNLLEDLFENGFRHLGLETLTPSYGDSTKFLMDTLLNERGYPLDSPLSGFYTREPQMGNLVREAIRIGFTVFGYESTDRKVDRDLQQAINIKKYMDLHHNEKVVIHCGWYHAIESDYPKRKSDSYMAYHLRSLTGIDPLTIYQDALSERSTGKESPYYKMINSKEVSVLLDEAGNVFAGFEEKRNFDIFIYHPKTNYIRNRPDWILQSNENQFVPIEKQRIQVSEYPVIVAAIPIGEEYSVPVDIVELLKEDDPTELILKKGEYLIRITNKNKGIKEYEIKIE
jgi:hypothetical protein